MIEYRDSDKHYTLSYQELREKYIHFVGISDMEFIAQINEALHLACVICWLKEIPTQHCLNDTGIIHELVHIIHLKDNFAPITHIRKLFNETLELK